MLVGVLPCFANTLKTQSISTSVVNLFVHSLLRHPESFTDSGHCKLIFDDFLLTWVKNEEILHHILRLLWCSYEKIDSQILVAILTAAQPDLQVCVCYILNNILQNCCCNTLIFEFEFWCFFISEY